MLAFASPFYFCSKANPFSYSSQALPRFRCSLSHLRRSHHSQVRNLSQSLTSLPIAHPLYSLAIRLASVSLSTRVPISSRPTAKSAMSASTISRYRRPTRNANKTNSPLVSFKVTSATAHLLTNRLGKRISNQIL